MNDLHGFWSYYNTNNGAVAFGYLLDNDYAYGSGRRQDFSRGYMTWDAVNQIVWYPTRPLLGLDQNGVLTWSGNYILQSASNVSGPFEDISGAISPFTNNQGVLPQQFFRLRN